MSDFASLASPSSPLSSFPAMGAVASNQGVEAGTGSASGGFQAVLIQSAPTASVPSTPTEVSRVDSAPAPQRDIAPASTPAALALNTDTILPPTGNSLPQAGALPQLADGQQVPPINSNAVNSAAIDNQADQAAPQPATPAIAAQTTTPALVQTLAQVTTQKIARPSTDGATQPDEDTATASDSADSDTATSDAGTTTDSDAGALANTLMLAPLAMALPQAMAAPVVQPRPQGDSTGTLDPVAAQTTTPTAAQNAGAQAAATQTITANTTQANTTQANTAPASITPANTNSAKIQRATASAPSAATLAALVAKPDSAAKGVAAATAADAGVTVELGGGQASFAPRASLASDSQPVTITAPQVQDASDAADTVASRPAVAAPAARNANANASPQPAAATLASSAPANAAVTATTSSDPAQPASAASAAPTTDTQAAAQFAASTQRVTASDNTNTTTATAPTDGTNMAALVDRLVEARQIARSGGGVQNVQTAINHAEFGRVAINIRQDEQGMAVSMTSSDPTFAPAAQAALDQMQINAGATDNAANTATGGQQQGGQSGGQSANGQNGTSQNGSSPNSNAQNTFSQGFGQSTQGQSSQGQNPQGQSGQQARWADQRETIARQPNANSSAQDTASTLSRRAGILA